MALSGSASKGFARHSLIIEWSATQSIADNNSTVTAKVYLQSNDQYGAMDAPATNYGSVTVNGVTKNFTANSNLSAYQKKLLTTQSFVVGHNADGTKSFNFSTTYNINVTFSGVFYGNQTASGSATLNTIARASSISSVVGGTIGSPITVNISRASSAFTHKLWYYTPDGNYVLVAENIATSHTFTRPLSDCAFIPSATSADVKISIGTYSGNTLIGGYVYHTFKAYVPATVIPTKPTLNVVEGNSAVASLNLGSFVQNKSQVNASAGASGVYGSWITDYTFKFNGQSQSGMVGRNFNVGSAVGTKAVEVIVTDSRGRQNATSVNINISAYSPPSASLHLSRVNNGNLVDAVVSVSITNVGNKGGSWWIDRADGSSWTNVAGENIATTVNKTVRLSGTYAVGSSFNFRMNVNDAFGGITLNGSITTAKRVLHIKGESGVGIGKIWQRGSLDVNGSTYLEHLTATGDTALNDVSMWGLEVRGTGIDVSGGARIQGGVSANGTVTAKNYASTYIPVNANLNDYLYPGWYYNPANVEANTMTNLPVKLSFSLFVEKHAGVKQTFTVYESSVPRTWIRNFYAGVWSAWDAVVLSSQVQYIANGNGSAIRFPNGVQICYMWRMTAAGNVDAAYGPLWSSSNTRWTYPAAFVTHPPSISIQSDSGVAWTWGALGANAQNTSYCEFIVVSATRADWQATASLTAIGRWY